MQPVQVSVTDVVLFTVWMVAPSGRSPPDTWSPTSDGPVQVDAPPQKWAVAEVTVALDAVVTPSVTWRPLSVETRTLTGALVQPDAYVPLQFGQPEAMSGLLRVIVVPETALTNDPA